MRSNLLNRYLAGLFMVMGVTIGWAQGETASLAGTWIINIQNPNIPNAEKVVLTFTNENGVIKGSMNNDTPLQDVKVANDRLSFSVTIGPPGSPKIPFTGTIAGAELHLKAPLTVSEGSAIKVRLAYPEPIVHPQ